MKYVVSLLTVSAVLFCAPVSGFAAEEKMPKKKAAESSKKPAEQITDAPAKVVGEGKAIPMHVRADALDVRGKSFTLKRKDGVEVKHVLTADTTIMNGETPAKLADVKVGDYVSGLRLKKSDTEYEVVKISKFGPAAPKKAKAEGEAKPE